MDRSLSKNEAKVVLDLEWRNQKTVTLEDLRVVLGASDEYARYMAHRLVHKGWLERLRPGLFQLIPASRGREAVADTNPLLASATLAHPYFFSFGTACTHHRFTEQVFAEVYLACRERRRPQAIRGARYVLAYVSENHFFGFEETSVLGAAVQMATPERALADALDRPHYAGGVGEVSRMVARSLPRLSPERLIPLLERWGESALAQRLGYLADLHEVECSPTLRTGLERLVRPGSKVLLGPRGRWGTSGTLARRWNIIENVPRDVLVEKGAARRRRVKFPPSDTS
ncbi:MAG TPA: type IV toxin-antitoxin system AbiEi family antitoxin domain-containing protein [Kofleriaceae bacterium]|nr:type IV toxin-antitoxin system AbiEi family antitoxin domain-containing protein [Kofleriaceae bacterium]